MAQREALEIEADALHNELSSANALPGTPLIDGDGFPRGDIDIVNTLEKRQRIAVINTDHKALMKDIEHALRMVHEQATEESGPLLPSKQITACEPGAQSGFTSIIGQDVGIARVDEVSDGSPAQTGGLQIGDLMLAFGSVSKQSASNPLSLIPGIVQQNLNKPVAVLVRRGAEVVELKVTPSLWCGRGVLGCHLAPL
ncbi:unnamed protein product [Ectocarpus fasciculatus]